MSLDALCLDTLVDEAAPDIECQFRGIGVWPVILVDGGVRVVEIVDKVVLRRTLLAESLSHQFTCLARAVLEPRCSASR